MKGKPYGTLALALAVHLLIMFALTYAGVYRLDHVYANLNRFYMALLMVAPMAIVMVAFMWHMFPRRALNVAILGLAVVLFAGTFAAIRAQALVGDMQFLRSMIPHHSIAIKTCERAQISDPEITKLCEQIVRAQREEIAQMEDIIRRLD
ncbi:MAG TPA: DUF305 domain-containing protein [Egibacteraceae bacterium]|nr:DUF305 domain-containing protein [Egibacteraceae bacterium]